ncbi:hypothetical protein LTR36_000708 [Oleoguttula mirabilis]|uniref:DUF7626 domain-containing protein n=1 Tax=Oleoguttula mirabilis TaxID=1507867 RepID=A0AAV9JQI0_9PEZI|nr:hypothetical protein LTR36_000708 [Oleoguttula mirabilis]
MTGLRGGLLFGGTEAIEPTGRDDLIANGIEPNGYHADDSDADEDHVYENPQTGERSLKRAASPTANGQHASKKPFTLGGRAAIPKRIVADYDSDDGRIISLKQQGYSDEYVAQKMIQEGRIRYVPKTVGSRWLRLRKALEQAESEKLDDELTDWHVDEDELLKKSYDAIEDKFEREVQKVIDRKWKEVSANLADRLHRKKYTAKSCQERLNGVQNGTALLPIEIDQNKEGRKQLRDNRIAAAKLHRAEQAAEAQRAEEERKQRLEDKKADAAEKERERITKVHEREDSKAEELRIKQEKAVDRERKRAMKKAATDQAKAEAEWEKKKRSADAALYAKYTGKRMPGAPRVRRAPATRRAPGGACRGGRRSRDDFVTLSEDEEDSVELSDEDEVETVDDESDAIEEGSSTVNAGSISSKSTPAKARKKATVTTKPKVTKETLLNPRSVMTSAELEVLLFERDLARRTGRETHPQMVARLNAADEDLSTTEISDLLSKFFDKGKGSKEAKTKRLQEHEAAKSAAGGNSVKATDLAFKKGYEGYKGEYSGLIEDEDEEMEG